MKKCLGDVKKKIEFSSIFAQEISFDDLRKRMGIGRRVTQYIPVARLVRFFIYLPTKRH